MKLIKSTKELIEVTFHGEKNYINIEDILYIESLGRIRLIHTMVAVHESRETIDELSKRLPKNSFASPHKSFLVNLSQVKKSSATQLLLSNGETIGISRGCQIEFVRSMHQYILLRGCCIDSV